MSTSVTIEPRWYIVHTYSGHEERVKNNLEIRVSNLDMGHKIFEVVMPTEKTVEINSLNLNLKNLSSELGIFLLEK